MGEGCKVVGDLGDHGRFSDPSLLVMSSLADGPKHGYAMTKDIERFAGITLGPGTLYGALARLQHQGLILALQLESLRQVAATGLRRLAKE
jgi:DNA-binding PadR family transcriptional regulator